MMRESPPSPTPTGYDVARVVFIVIGLTFAGVAVLFLTFGALAELGSSAAAEVPGPLLFAIEALVIWFALWLVLIRKRKFTWADLGWVPVSWGWLLLGVISCAAIYTVAISIRLLLGQLDNAEDVTWIPDPLPLFPASVMGYALSIAFGAVAVPIAEEFLFRGVLYRWLRSRWGVFNGIVGSSLIFALVHPPAAGGALQIFLIGLVLAWLYEKAGSLWPSMALHCCNNAIGITLIYTVLWLDSG